LLSLSIWILVKSGWVAAMMPFHIAVASAIKSDDHPKLNGDA